MTVDALQEITGASAITIRRDLAELSEQGLVRRVRGGATRAERRGQPMPFALRLDADRERKQALAAVAGSLVDDHEAIILDNGTTCFAVAQRLVGRPVTVLALSLHAAAAVAARPEATVLVPGGQVENDTLAFTGLDAVRSIEELRADVVVLGACSAQPGLGLTSTSHADAQVKRACLAASARAVLVTTADKLGRSSAFRFGDPSDLTDLVTTADADEKVLSAFREQGVTVHLVDVAPATS